MLYLTILLICISIVFVLFYKNKNQLNNSVKIILLISIGVLFLSLYKNISSEFDDLTLIKSTVDGREYYVQNLPDKQQACDNLAKLRAILIKIVTYMKEKFPNNDSILRLYKNFNPDKIVENPNDSRYTSYSVNKGEKIVFCIRQRNKTNDLVDMNTLTFVAIHELAHLMTKSVGHNDDFWENMKFLLKEIIHSPLGVYSYVDFSKTPQEYCGTIVSDTPYKMN